MKKLIVLRGLPSTGKSYLANNLEKEAKNRKIEVKICSADHFFMKSGQYIFDGTKLGLAHRQCRMSCEIAMNREVPLIIIDNTNTTAKEAQPYITMAHSYGYEVEIMEPNTPWKNSLQELEIRNSHGVKIETLEKMAARWEPLELFKRKLGI